MHVALASAPSALASIGQLSMDIVNDSPLSPPATCTISAGPQNRCASCAYPIDGLPGAPARCGGAMTADVVCPECGFSMPAGCHVLLGAVNSEDLSRTPLWRRIAGFLGRNWLYFAGGAWLLPRIVESLLATGSVTIGWRLILAILLLWGFAKEVVRFVKSNRRVSGDSDELAGAVAASWLVAPSGLSQVRWPMKQTRLPESLAAETIEGLRASAVPSGATAEPSGECTARITAFSRSPLDVPEGLANQTGLLIRCTMESLPSLASGLATTLGAPSGGAFGEPVSCRCPKCDGPAQIPTADVSEHPSWCTVSEPWQCKQCALNLAQGAVVATGSTEGDAAVWGARFGSAVFTCALFGIALAAVLAGLRLWDSMPLLLVITSWPVAAGAIVAIILWFRQGPVWRENEPVAWSNKSPRPMRVAWWTGSQAISIARWKLPKPKMMLKLEIERLEAVGRSANAHRRPWRPATLHLRSPQLALEQGSGAILAGPKGRTWRRFTFIPDDPRGYVPSELHDALARALLHARKPR